MPEYLAPGVYVEETSFRSKSIEGVSTSTTGFVGPCRKGPIGGTPELITSFGDFERIYGGLNDLTFSTNYLAHAVRAYFNEGGSRLYVSRVYVPGSAEGTAASNVIVGAALADSAKARFVARYSGDAGNGVMHLRQLSTPATRRVIERAPEGTMVQIGGKKPAAAARLTGGKAPFSLPNDGVLRLVVDGSTVDLTFRGASVEAIPPSGSPALGANVDLDDANTTLKVSIDGIEQEIALPTAAMPRADFVAAINEALRGGFARLSKAPEGGANKLVIGSDRRGKQALVTVFANAELGFLADTTVKGSDNPNNNVGDLLRVTADEIDAMLAPGNKARASLNADGDLVFSTVATGVAAMLQVVEAADPTKSVHSLLGFAVPTAEAKGAAGTEIVYFVKKDGVYANSTGTLNFGTTPSNDEHSDGSELITITVAAEDKDGRAIFYEEMAFDKLHPRWIGNVLAEKPSRRADQLENMFAVRIGDDVDSLALRASLFPAGDTNNISLTGGTDGLQPIQGDTETSGTYEAALKELERLDDISIVAAPGYSSYADYQGIQGALIAHAERRRSYRIAVLDTPKDQLVSGARSERGRIDSKYAAMYYPWIVISNPQARPGDESIPRELMLPPSGFVCGIYARNDIERGVFKAPANEVVRAALRFETDINFAEQEVLNPIGVNCLRFFSGRGYRVWGARTASSDPEWKYVNIRRYFNYLEASIDRGTQWAVFEPNGERLWANIRDTVSGFLYNEWKSGALLGTTVQEAYFVRCDRSTMTQNDLDNGRLICEIGVAAIKPAEFVIFRIGQKTADARN
ncbi:MAG TPA: phage tail sheath subtilisin-like domain-containing protein [Pyrinomonadaceae bacterium]|nr:phage tail sheath subtilisin-like domain-containing protein [Pyrinomonadaceae bacterium]